MNTFVTLMEAYGTKWEHKIPKNTMTIPPPLPKGKKYWAFWVHVASPHWLLGIPISLMLITIFQS
jgi:hypothetical protein